MPAALGDVATTLSGQSCTIQLLLSATATSAIPTTTAGILLPATLGYQPDHVRVGVRSTAGSDTMTASVRPWIRAGGIWYCASAAVDLIETSADSIQTSFVVGDLAGADRLYLQITAIGGTATAIEAFAIIGRDATE